MEEEHVHRFTNSGVGCYCGVRQCQHTWMETKPGYRPVKKYCQRPAASGQQFCALHLTPLAVGAAAK